MSAATRPSTAGRVAFGFALAVLVIAVASQAVRWLQPILLDIAGMPAAVLQFLVDWVPTGLGIVALLTMIVASIALTRRGHPLLPSIALGVGLLGTVSIGASWLFRLLTTLTAAGGS